MESEKRQETSEYNKKESGFTNIENKPVVTRRAREKGRGNTEVGE